MAGRRKVGGEDVGEGLRKLWKTVNPGTWAQLLREVAPQNEWQLAGTTIKGRCPYHDDSDPSFVLDFAKGYGRCYGAGCNKYVTNIVALFSKLLRVSDAEATLWLNQRIDLSSALGSGVADQIGAYSLLQDMKKAAAMAFSQVVQEYIRDKPEKLSYLEPGFLYLTKGRNIPIEVLGALPVSLFPKPEHAKKYIPEAFHAEYDKYFQKYQNARYWGSVIFHYNDSPGSISRFKVRLLARDVQRLMDGIREAENPPSDRFKGLVTKEFLVLEDQYFKRGTGVFGLHHYARSIGSTDACVYVTEGEFDALAVMAGQMMTGRHDFVMLASGGEGNTSIGFLREFGIRVVYLVQDSPAKKGDGVAQSFLRDKTNFARDSSNIKLQFKIFSWPVGMQGGDLDEAVQLMGYEDVSSYLEQGDNFVNALPWVVQKCSEAIDGVKSTYDNKMAKAEKDLTDQIRSLENDRPEDWEAKVLAAKTQLETAKANNSDDYMRDAISVVRTWATCLSDPSDLKVFLQACSQDLGMDVTELEPEGSTTYRPDTAEGAVAIVKRTLPNYLDMTYYDRKDGRTVQHMWSKTKFEDVTVPTNEQSFSAMFAQHVGMTLVEWLKTHLGGNSVIEPKSEKCDPSGLEAEKKRSENAKFLMRQVLESMSSRCNALDELKEIGQGIHYTDLSEEARRKNYVYIVNGAKLFRGTYGKGAGLPVEWELINSNVDCGMKFKLDKSQKWSFIEDVDHLYAATRIDLKQLYENVQKVVGCWKFKNNDVMQWYLPAYIMAIPYMTAMGYVTMMFLQGQKMSGKTAFLQGLLGGLQSRHPVRPLIESAKYTMNASIAWLQREADRSSLMVCLDESENKEKTTHGSNVKEIQHALYSVPTGGSVITRAASDGSANTVDYFLFMPVVMAGINMYADDVFMSRVFVVMTEKDPKMQACELAISALFSDEEYAALRQQVTLSMLPYMPQLAHKAAELKKVLDNAIRDIGGNTRFVNLILPGLAVLSIIYPNIDILEHFKQLIDVNRDRLDAINNEDNTNSILEAALNLPGVKAPNADGIIDNQRARTLIMNGEIQVLNNADCGVYCIPSKHCIVFVWKFIKHSIFNNKWDYGRMRENSMREEALQSKHTVTDVSDEDHEYIKKFCNLSQTTEKTEYSVVRLDCIMSKEDQDALEASFAGVNTINRKNEAKDVRDNVLPIEVYEDDDVPYAF